MGSDDDFSIADASGYRFPISLRNQMNSSTPGNASAAVELAKRVRLQVDRLPDQTYGARYRLYDNMRKSVLAPMTNASPAARQAVIDALNSGIALVELEFAPERPSIAGLITAMGQTVVACTVIVGFIDFLKPLVNLQSFGVAAFVFLGLLFIYLGRLWQGHRRLAAAVRNIAFGSAAALVGLFGVQFAFDDNAPNGALAEAFSPVAELQALILRNSEQLGEVSGSVGRIESSTGEIAATTERIEATVSSISDGSAVQEELRQRIVAAGYAFDSEGRYAAITDGDPASDLYSQAGLPLDLQTVLDMLVTASPNSTDFARVMAFVDKYAPGEAKRVIRDDIAGLLTRIRQDDLLSHARRLACSTEIKTNDDNDWIERILAGECAEERDWFQNALRNAVAMLDSVNLAGDITNLTYTVESEPVEFTDVSLNRGLVALKVVYKPILTDEGLRLFSTNHRLTLRAKARQDLLSQCGPINGFYNYCAATAHVFVDQSTGQIVVMNLTDERPERTPSVRDEMAAVETSLPWTGAFGGADLANHAFIAAYQSAVDAGLRVECGLAPGSDVALFIARGSAEQVAKGLFDNVMRDKVGETVPFRILYNGRYPFSQGTVQPIDSTSARFLFDANVIDYLNSVDTFTFQIGNWPPLEFSLLGFSEALAANSGTGC